MIYGISFNVLILHELHSDTTVRVQLPRGVDFDNIIGITVDEAGDLGFAGGAKFKVYSKGNFMLTAYSLSALKESTVKGDNVLVFFGDDDEEDFSSPHLTFTIL